MKKKSFILAISLIALTFGSCRKPYQEEIYVEVQPNEAAYVIPLETGSKDGQTKLKSEGYLEQNKVVSQRIYTPTQWHQTGRWGNEGKWIESVRVIKVNRTPITREWTKVGSGTNSDKQEAIGVESRESIAFKVGITATASIPDEWTTRFLYNYNGIPLSQVMDDDVRGFIQNVLTTEFGIRDLSQCQTDRKIIYDLMRNNTIEHFAKLGVRIINIGASGGFDYDDKSIQDAINEKFSSEMKISAAKNEVEAANKFAQARSAIEAQKNLDADINIKNAIADGIRTGNIPVPSTIAGSNISIMDLYGLKSLTSKSSK